MTKVFAGADKKRMILLFIVGALGVLLIIFGYISPWKDKSAGKAEENKISLQTMEYIHDIENKIRSMTEMITGSKDISVIVSADSGTEYVYVSNEDLSGSDISREYITVKNESGVYELVLAKEVYPEIIGVSIACPNGDDYSVRRKIIDSISTAYGISKNRICVVGTK